MPKHSKHIDRTKPVAYLQGDGNYTTLHYPDGKTVLASTTLKKVSAWYPHIIQVRKGIAINPTYVVSYNRYSAKGLTVHLEFANTRITFEASRRRVASVEEAVLLLELTPYF
ncbi:hypothetical protein GCM10028818_33320 [Spirosoma horti]